MHRLMVSLGLVVVATTAYANAVVARNAPMCNRSWTVAGATELRPIAIEGNSSTTRLVIMKTKRTTGNAALAILDVDDENNGSTVVEDIQDTGERWIYTVQPPLHEAVIRWRKLSTKIFVDRCLSE